jgi:hypothetical protein
MRPLLLLICSLTMPAYADNHTPSVPPPAIHVTGMGEATAAPDRARLVLITDKIDLNLAKAQSHTSGVVKAYLKAIEGLAVKEIDTSQITVNPEYEWVNENNNGKQVFKGYRVSRTISIQTVGLDNLGDFLQKASTVGITQIQPPVLESSKARDTEREAMRRAALDAKDRAELLASTLGVKIGTARQIHANSNQSFSPPPQQPVLMKAMSADTGNADMGISAGSLRYQATVTVEFGMMP